MYFGDSQVLFSKPKMVGVICLKPTEKIIPLDVIQVEWKDFI